MMIAPPLLQRSCGRVEVAFSRRDGAIRLDRLYQEGCAKALLPRTAGAMPEVVLINTAGGLTGGDRLGYDLAAGAGAGLVVTTQAAERVYRSTGAVARIDVRLTLAVGAELAWLPQETILFQSGRLERRLEADMASDARLTVLESLVLGRAAMGETLSEGRFIDQWRVRRGGRLVHAEALRLDGDLRRATAGRATLAGARAMATLAHLAPDAETRLADIRALLPACGDVQAAATVRGDVLIVRLVAADHAPLRPVLVRVLAALRGAPCPSVWSL